MTDLVQDRQVRSVTVIQPMHGVPLHFLISFTDGTCQRKNVIPHHALRLAADLINGATFELGMKTTET